MALYCINPQCKQRENPDNIMACLGCGTDLQIRGEKSTYQLIHSFRELNKEWNAEVFKVTDIQNGGKHKVLKLLSRDTEKHISLFRQEQKLFLKLKHTGIPKGYDSFSKTIANQNIECLVMEWIEGQNLEEWVQRNGPINKNLAIEWLHQIISILNYIHQEKFFHRDIKPSNIMRRQDGQLVLIDFGTARQVTQSVVDGHLITRVFSHDYTPEEQLHGKANPKSDIFALGRTFVYFLTGQSPSIENWKQNILNSFDSNFLDLLDEMMNVSWEQRPSSSDILERINILKQESNSISSQFSETLVRQGDDMQKKFKKRKGLIIASLVSIGLLSLIALIFNSDSMVAACDDKSGDFLSCGEEFLTQEPPSKDMLDGRTAWNSKAFEKAADLFKKSKSKPETLIYANNAAINNSKSKIYTIAVVVPLQGVPGRENEDRPDAIGLEILRGVAQAQNEFNSKKSEFKIRVLIADDSSREDQAKTIAQSLVQKTEILAVIGHYASDVTVKVLPIYESTNSAESMVLVSPTSTAVELSQDVNKKNNFFFRTVSTTKTEANALARYLKTEDDDKKHLNVAVFYNSRSVYSRSLKEQFDDEFQWGGTGNVLPPIDLSNKNFEPKKEIDKAIKKGVTALAIFPDGHTSSNTFKNAIELIKVNQGRLRIGNRLRGNEGMRI